MNNLFFILPAIAIATLILFYILTRNAQEIEEVDVPVIKFQPRNVTDLSKSEAPKKKKYYKKRKKKPAITNNAPVEKRPVGRPRKSE